MKYLFIISVSIFFIQNLAAQSGQRVWIYFKDKGNVERGEFAPAYPSSLSQHALQRRLNQGKFPLVDYTDLRLEPAYIQKIQELGYVIHRQSRWLNAVSIQAGEADGMKLMTLPFVLKIEGVCSHRFQKYPEPASINKTWLGKTGQDDYGPSENQNKMIGITEAHALGFHGEGIRIALFDTGFNLQHESLKHLQIIATRDFVQGDTNVANEGTDSPSQHNHGSEVLAVIGGFKPGQIIGPAYAAEFLLAKTEIVNSETHVEEDNWVAAAEWADSMGADIISTSLGYSNFDSGQVDYTYADMDGNTTIITRAADLAVSKGISVFASAGNEGNDSWYYITAPADGDSVIAMGGVRPDGSAWSTSSNGPTSDGRIKPDLVAQGQSVYSINPNSVDQYITASGTSFASPLGAGAAAILLSTDPTMTPMQLRELMISSATKAQNPDNKMGYGLIDLEESMAHILTTRIVQVTDFGAQAANGRNVLTWTATSKMKIKDWIIERKTAGSQFSEIGRLAVPDNQIYPAVFEFTDLAIAGGEYFQYRLQSDLAVGISIRLDTLYLQSVSPQQIALYQNFPNPFNAETRITFSLPQQQQVRLMIYDRMGQLVKVLVDNINLPSAFHHYIWDGNTEKGNRVASGIYFIVFTSPSHQKVIKAALLK